MKLFLMRHGQPESDGARRCIGVTDVLLSESGKERARIVAEALKPFKIKKIYTSPLQRCVSTAEIVKNVLNLPDFEIVDDLREMNMGEWDGLTFDAIQKHWPEAYQTRGRSLGTYIVDGGESFAQAGQRFELALRKIGQGAEKQSKILKNSSNIQDEGIRASHFGGSCQDKVLTDGRTTQPDMFRKNQQLLQENISVSTANAALKGAEWNPDSGLFATFSMRPLFHDDENLLIIAHAGAMRGCFCRLLGLSPNDVLKLPMPYGGISVIDGSTFQAEQIGVLPSACLNGEEIQGLYKKHRVPENIIRHMQRTADLIGGLSEKMTGLYDWAALKQAALVHDLARTQPNHDLKTAEILRMAGYDRIARWIAAHHGRERLPEMITPLIFPLRPLFDGEDDGQKPSAAELLFYADKCVLEDRVVSIDARFAASAVKCKTPEAKAKHRRLYTLAKKIEEKIEFMSGAAAAGTNDG